MSGDDEPRSTSDREVPADDTSHVKVASGEGEFLKSALQDHSNEKPGVKEDEPDARQESGNGTDGNVNKDAESEHDTHPPDVNGHSRNQEDEDEERETRGTNIRASTIPTIEVNESPVEESADQATSAAVAGNIQGDHESSRDTPPPEPATRIRSDTRSTTTSQSGPVSSTVFVVTALEAIAGSKEARRQKNLESSVKAALVNVRGPEQLIDPEIIFRPLQLASKTYSIPLQVTALDCIGKLISYSYFAFPSAQNNASANDSNQEAQPALIERAIETICDCFENEATAIEIQQQIVKSLLAAVLNDKIVVHGAGLLKAVRQIYNIFIYSKSSQNQQVAQGSLTQMVATVFDRVHMRLDLKAARLQDHSAGHSEEELAGDESILEQAEINGDSGSQSSTMTPKENQQKLTLQSFENNQNLDDAVVADNAPTMVTRVRGRTKPPRSGSGHTTRASMQDDQEDADVAAEEEEDEIYIKDAFLVFRSLCKLSQKVLTHDQQQDLKSQNMRSKLLSLHLIHHLLNNHIDVFISPLSLLRSGGSGETTAFMQVAKPHLCLSLSRNASSSVPRVFEVCCEIFWLSLKNMRVMLKKELEVFLKEVYLAVLERRSAPMFQKLMFMNVLEKLSADPRALVEIYLNYDCDRTALDNMYQGVIEHLSRIASASVQVTPVQQLQYQEILGKLSAANSEWQQRGSLLPGLSTASISHSPMPSQSAIPDYQLKQQSLQCLIEILASLDNWSSQLSPDGGSGGRPSASRTSLDDARESLDHNGTIPPSPRISSGNFDNGTATPIAEDDPNEIEKVKKRKTALNEAIRQFNFKPKRGVKKLKSDGFIKSDSPEDIARFLITNDRLDKAALGEYLGEGDPQNVAIMHAFVDTMEFARRRFVDALRQFLQSFRLPGEAQKIDRFMLKFAERYLTGNPNAFANADTAYVLAYSVIMLNTDQHSAKIKGHRMTVEDFIKNNRGINDDQDLPAEYLTGIYEEIASNEIVLTSERERAEDLGAPVSTPAAGLASRAGKVLANVGRDLQKEKYAQASEEMANKTEQLYRSLIRAQKRSVVREALSRFIPASSIKHVGPMLNVTWMSFLSALSSQLQDAQNIELIRQCLEGLKLAIRISCRFDLETPRVAFVTALAKFTNLGNVKEMMAKNLEALKVLIDVALTEGDVLKGSWREILTCISQLDRLQLLSGGVDEGAVPDVNKAQIPVPSNVNQQGRSRRSLQAQRRPGPRPANASTSYRSDVALETRSSDMVRGVDRIFTNTANLSSEAILDFIRALSEISWQEIQSSGQSDSPRTYSLQKLVEISYYNMGRVRIEWTRIWEILGEHFNQVGCHSNTAVVFFALDSLRQLSMRFMEIEELPGFKFQKDFLKPFEHVMANSNVVTVKDMVLRCLIQMIQARGDNIRSGWKTMFGVFAVAAQEQYASIVDLAYDYTIQIYNTRFGIVISQGAFADLIVCLTQFSKNLKFQKRSLNAIETLRSTVPRMLRTPECPLSRRHGRTASSSSNGVASGVMQPTPQSEEEQFWYPVLIAYQDVLMTGEDLEVRSLALTYLFETLIKYGGDFPISFWEVLWRQLLYPIFVVLQSRSEMSRAPNHEDLSVWLSTTMIQALRNMITLFTHYFDSLEHMLDRFLDLLALCICQENDTIARIGSNCLQQLILQNVNKFRPEHWAKIVGAFVELFNRTTAYELFSAAATMSDARTPNISSTTTANDLAISTSNGATSTTTGDHNTDPSVAVNSSVPTDSETTPAATAEPSGELEDYRPQVDTNHPAPVVTAARRRFFNKIITNCVLQLLMIETVNELFSNDNVYTQIPSSELLRLMGLLKKSYQFAKKFNGDKDLRMQLWRQGFMRQPPNLLKQESGSANTYISILLRMYHDPGEERLASRADTEAALIPLCADILRSYTSLDEETQQRNITAWRPVVVDVMEGFINFPRDSFDRHIETFYPLAIALLERDLGAELRGALWALLRRLGELRMGMAELPTPTPGATPTSPGRARSFEWSRRSSRASVQRQGV